MNESYTYQNFSQDNYLFCPNNNCLNIPEILYTYNPLNSFIEYKCNYHNNKKELYNMPLSAFLEKSSNIKCYECQQYLTKSDLYYCNQCKNVFDYTCFEEHIEICNHNVVPINKNILINNCLEHINIYMFHCIECNKSLCLNCDITYHHSQRHSLVQIINNTNNQNDKEKINTIFQKQKYFLEKIKKINHKIIKSLEDDIEIKQRIIDNNNNNKYNYNLISSYNNLYIENDYRYEKLLEYIFNTEEMIEKNKKEEITKGTYLNRILAPFYYSMMINKDQNLKEGLIELLQRLILNINQNNEINTNEKNNITNINNTIMNNDKNLKNNNKSKNLNKIINYDNRKDNSYINIENNRNNNNFNISVDCSKRYYNIANDKKNKMEGKYYNEKMNLSNNNKNIQENINLSNNTMFEEYIRNNNKNNEYLNKSSIFNHNIKLFGNNESGKSNIKNNGRYFDNNDILFSNSIKYNNFGSQHLKTQNNIFLKNIENTPNISNNNNLLSVNKTYNNTFLKDNNEYIEKNNTSLNNTLDKLKKGLNNKNKVIKTSENVNKQEKKKKTPIKENKLDKELNNNNKAKETEKVVKTKNNKHIFNMIILHTGNFAISMKEAVEIYDFRKLDLFNKKKMLYNNQEIDESNCLLQRINLVKGKKINYVFEFPDKTLLCATYAKIFRLELTNNDVSHNILGIIKLENSELPTKLISLGDSLLVILSEKKVKCNLKIYIKNNKDNKINLYKMSDTQSVDSNEKELSEKDYNSNDYSDVPPIGNSLFAKKDIEIDPDFNLLKQNINKENKLLLSMYEIKRDINNEYLYEFIVTSNKVYDHGDNRIEFYGAQKQEKFLYFYKIKVINNISCSIQVNSICSINNQYICIGLQNHNLIGQISGFAIIDVFTREICRIIRDQEISSLYFNLQNNILVASMEVRDIKNNFFMTKMYKVAKTKGDKGKEEIDLKNIFEYKNEHNDTIISVSEINTSRIKFNIEQEEELENLNENIILVTASHDSTLEVIKSDIKK